MSEEYFIIVNPAGHYPEMFLQEAKAFKNLRAIAFFTHEGKYDVFNESFAHLKDQFYKTIVCLEGSREKKVSVLEGSIGKIRDKLKSVIAWDDSGIRYGGLISDCFSLPWLSADEVERLKNKYLMKEHLRSKTSIRVNRFTRSSKVEDIISFQEELGKWPVVLKPTDAGGGWNVYMARNLEDIKRFSKAILESYNDYDQCNNEIVFAEEFIGGQEYCVNGQTDKSGNIIVTDMFHYVKGALNNRDHIYLRDDYMPPAAPEVKDIVLYAIEVVKSTELRNSPFHLELKVDDNGPCLLEVSPRLAGDLAYLISKSVQPRLMELAFRSYMNELELEKSVEIFYPAESIYATALEGVSEQEGVIERIDGLEEVEKLESFVGYSRYPKIGSYLVKTIDLDTVPYLVLLGNKNRTRLESDVLSVRKLIRFHTKS